LPANGQCNPADDMNGEALIARLYNAIRANAALWTSTLLVVVYDEHGGFFDHAPPPEAIPPDNKTSEYAFDQYGIRVPAVLISPLVRSGKLSTRFDHTSILKYARDKWGLADLTARVANRAHLPTVFCPTFAMTPQHI
jgi:phospholipase C